jgi:hypothetical protein
MGLSLSGVEHIHSEVIEDVPHRHTVFTTPGLVVPGLVVSGTARYSEVGAETVAIFNSLVCTCKMNGINNILEYLTDIPAWLHQKNLYLSNDVIFFD